MSRKNRTPEENERRAKIRELLQMGGISSMDDIQNLFKETIAEFMENSLDAELDDELGYSNIKYIVQEIDEQNAKCTEAQVKLDEIYQQTIDRKK